MPGFTPFTSNYQDLSTNQGYQFEFRCDECQSGYRSEYQKNLLGVGGSILGGASSILGSRIGGLWGAANAANTAQDITDRDARDKALQKASNEIMPLFHRCVRCNNWVDETCFNKARGLCVRCAPNLAAEMEAERSSVEISQMREAVGGQQIFSGDTSARATECPSCGKPVGSEKFCGNCGTPLGVAKCSKCGAELASGTTFCGNCGTKVA
jgi:Double zinc ribbon